MNSIMDIIYIPFGWLMGVFYNWTGNYAIALLFFAIVVNLLMLPFGIKQHKNMIKGAKLRPKTMAIEKKYAGKTDQVSMQKKQEEIMELNRSAGYSPFSGCLPMLLQMPIIIALFRIIRNPLTYILSVGDDAITNIIKKVNEAATALGNTPIYQNIEKLDVRNMDQIKLVSDIKAAGLESAALEAFEIDALPNFTIFGGAIDLSAAPQSDFWSLLLLIPIISALLAFAQMKLSRKLNPTLAQAGNQSREVRMSNVMMDLTMPLMSLWISYITSAAVGVYWIYRSLLSMVQTVAFAFIMPMPKFTEEDYAAAEREMRPGKRNNSKSVPAARPGAERPRSLHHIDDDDELPYELKARPNNNKNQYQGKKKNNNNHHKKNNNNNSNKPKPAPIQSAPAETKAEQPKPAATGIESAPVKDDSDR